MLDPLLLTAEVLRDQELASNFKSEFKKKRYYSNPNTCNRFREIQETVRVKFGKDVHVLGVNLSSDKTEKDLFPVYVSCPNFDKTVFSKDKAIAVCGFVPQIPYSRAKFYEILESNGVTTQARQKVAYKLCNQ